MDPCSKEGLLTEHPEGNHGDGGASGDQSSLRQGAGIGTSADPNLRIAAGSGTVVNIAWRSPPRGFLEQEVNIGQRGASGVAPPGQAARGRYQPLVVPGGRLARGCPPLRLFFRILESYVKIGFLGFFWIFLSTLIFHLFLHCTDKNREKLA